jgi:ABC-type multidrug transport system fused ATPase/permease subunit
MIHIDPAQSRVQMTSELSGMQQFLLLCRMLKFARPIWDKILLRALVLQFYALAALLPFVINAYLIDEVLLRGTSWDLAGWVAVYMGAVALQWGLHFIAQSTLEYLLNRVGMDLRWRYYGHLQNLSLRFYGTRPVGEHMFRCVDDIQTVTPQMAAGDSPSLQLINHPLDRNSTSNGTVWIVAQMINDVLFPFQQFALYGLLLASVSPYTLLIALVYLVVLFAGRQWWTTRMRNWDFKARAHGQGLNAILREALTATTLTQACGRERTVRRWFGAKLLDLAGATFRRDVASVSDTVYTECCGRFFLLLLVIAVGLGVIDQTMTVGDYYVLVNVFPLMVGPILALIQCFQFARLQLVPAERMLGTLDSQPDVADKPGASALEATEGHVKLESVSFAYDDEPVLRDVSIEAHPGEKIALVGRSGSGKSTIAKLVLRLYDVDEGRITIDGVDVSDVTQESLRRSIGAVMQDTFLFAASLRDNILYARPEASEEEMLRAARLARVDEFVESLPNGYDTVLSEGGNLSGGQRQRVCLARVLLRGARILILDEATSALDPLSENTIVSAVDSAFGASTRIVIAHNLAAIADADRVYVLDKGRVVETGKHDDLMAARGFYYRLWAREEEEKGRGS